MLETVDSCLTGDLSYCTLSFPYDLALRHFEIHFQTKLRVTGNIPEEENRRNSRICSGSPWGVPSSSAYITVDGNRRSSSSRRTCSKSPREVPSLPTSFSTDACSNEGLLRKRGRERVAGDPTAKSLECQCTSLLVNAMTLKPM